MKKFLVTLFLAATLISASTAQTKLGQQCGDWYLSIPDNFEFEATDNSGGFCFSGVTGVWEEKIILSRFIQGVYLSPGDSLGIWLELSSPAKKMKISLSLNNGSAVVLANRFETMGERVSFPVLTSFLPETLVIEMELPSIYPPAFRPTILSISKIALFYQDTWKRIDLLPDDLNDPGIPVAVGSSLQAPTEFTLYQNYPNPFNASTTIRFDLPQSGEATLAIYNLQGQLVRELITGVYSAGSHQIIWNGHDQHGQSVPSGIYFYKLTTTSQSAVKKLNLLK